MPEPLVKESEQYDGIKCLRCGEHWGGQETWVYVRDEKGYKHIICALCARPGDGVAIDGTIY